MLLELNVRDIALIKEASVNFRDGLNIMTGETGAGKSVIIGSCMLALGGKAKPDIVREGAESAYVELVFSVDERLSRIFTEMGFDMSDGTLVMSRKISQGRSVSRINGEAVNLKTLRDAAGYLIDIYGQNEYHTLMDPENHLVILDSYMGQEAALERDNVRKCWQSYVSAKSDLMQFDLDEEKKAREIELAQYEIGQIDEACLVSGEEEELAAEYKKLSNSRNIVEYMSRAHEILSEGRADSALSLIENAMRHDPELKAIRDEIFDAETIIGDALREISGYIHACDLSEERLSEVGKRLDLIRGLESRYGRTIEDILSYRSRKAARLEELFAYDENMMKAAQRLKESEQELKAACEALSARRKAGAVTLSEKIRSELFELGFDSVSLELLFSGKEPSENGADRVCFMVALNPGEKVKPISEVASGGELSRVMLSIKTVLAKTDSIPTLIFDEIDAGISGRTAQKVAEKLSIISSEHQVICITHLPQIAAMADTHFVITKQESGGRNVTEIRELSGAEPVDELARLLGGAEVTEAVIRNAAELKKLADGKKTEKRGIGR